MIILAVPKFDYGKFRFEFGKTNDKVSAFNREGMTAKTVCSNELKELIPWIAENSENHLFWLVQ